LYSLRIQGFSLFSRFFCFSANTVCQKIFIPQAHLKPVKPTADLRLDNTHGFQRMYKYFPTASAQISGLYP